MQDCHHELLVHSRGSRRAPKSRGVAHAGEQEIRVSDSHWERRAVRSCIRRTYRVGPSRLRVSVLTSRQDRHYYFTYARDHRGPQGQTRPDREAPARHRRPAEGSRHPWGGEGQGEGHNQDQGHRCSAQGHAETVDYGCRGQKGRLQANEGVLGETEEGQAVTECDLLLGPECFHRIHACHSTRCKPVRQDPDPHQPDGRGSKRLRIGCRHAEQQR